MSERLIGVVPARAGSKRLPNKNRLPVGGVPLVARAVRAGLNSGLLSRVIIDTDSTELMSLGVAEGAEAPFLRSPHLAADDTRMFDVVIDLLDRLEALEGTSPEAVVLLQPTSPLRDGDDVRTVIEAWSQDPEVPIASASRPLQSPRDLVFRTPSGGGQWSAFPEVASDADCLFIDGAVYVSPVKFMRRHRVIFELPFGRLAEIPPLHGIDVDEDFQLSLAHALVSESK